MGRVVTMVTKMPPDRFLAAGWPWLVGMAIIVLLVRPAVTLARYLVTVMRGMAVEAASGTRERELHQIVDMAMHVWPESNRRARRR